MYRLTFKAVNNSQCFSAWSPSEAENVFGGFFFSLSSLELRSINIVNKNTLKRKPSRDG